MMDQAVTRAAGATPSAIPAASAAPRLVGEFQGYVDSQPSVVWFDRKNMPAVGSKLYALPPRAATPRSWAVLLTSENHGTVGPVGCTFPWAGEKHERVQVMEIVEAGAPPAPGTDLGGLVRIAIDGTVIPLLAPQAGAPASTALTDDRIYDIAAASALGVGTGLGDMWNRAEFARAIEREVAAQAGQVAVPEGWKMVPVEPTAMMREAAASFGAPGDPSHPNGYNSQRGDEAVASWAHMLAAAPSAPAVVQQAPEQATPVPAESIECWSHNEEDFSAQSLGELIDIHELEPGATVWVGEAVHPEPKSLFSTDWLIENMGESAYDIAGEHGGEDYPNVSDEQVAELEALIVGWIAKCAPPNFWTVKNVRAYVLTAEDCGAQASTAGERQEGGA